MSSNKYDTKTIILPAEATISVTACSFTQVWLNLLAIYDNNNQYLAGWTSGSTVSSATDEYLPMTAGNDTSHSYNGMFKSDPGIAKDGCAQFTVNGTRGQYVEYTVHTAWMEDKNTHKNMAGVRIDATTMGGMKLVMLNAQSSSSQTGSPNDTANYYSDIMCHFRTWHGAPTYNVLSASAAN